MTEFKLLLRLWFWIANDALSHPDTTKTYCQYSVCVHKKNLCALQHSLMQTITTVLTIQKRFLCFSFEWFFLPCISWVVLFFFTSLNMKMPGSSIIFFLILILLSTASLWPYQTNLCWQFSQTVYSLVSYYNVHLNIIWWNLDVWAIFWL